MLNLAFLNSYINPETRDIKQLALLIPGPRFPIVHRSQNTIVLQRKKLLEMSTCHTAKNVAKAATFLTVSGDNPPDQEDVP